MNGRWTQQIAANEALDRARLALAGLRLDAALSAVRDAARHDPQDRSVRLLEAQVQLERGEPAAALSALDAATCYGETLAEAPMLWWLRAQALMRLARYAPAAAALRELLKLAPQDGRAWEALLSISEAMGDAQGIQEARAAMYAIQHTRHDAGSHTQEIHRLREAQRMLHSQRIADAAEALAPLIPDGADEPALLRQSAQIAEARGDMHRLAIDSERLATLEHRDRAARHDWWLKAGSAHLMLGAVDQAARCAWRAMRQQPDQPQAWALLMLTLRELGRARSAQKADRRLRRLTDRNTRRQLIARWWPAMTLARLAKSHASDAPSAPLHSANTGSTLLDELLEESHRSLDAYSQRWPQRADGHLHRAVVADAMGRSDEAIASLEISLTLNAFYDKASRMLKTLRSG